MNRIPKTNRRLRPGFKRKRKMTFEQREEAVSRYLKGEASTKIAANYGVTGGAIISHVVASGHQQRKTSRRKFFNETVFGQITPESAYWIGFLMADGCVSKNGGYLSITLAWRDRQHLRRLREFLNSIHKLTLHFSKDRPGHKPSVTFGVHSKVICADLRRFGLVARKTYSASVQELEMNRDFWRGMMDGDGSLGIYRDKRYAFTKGQPMISLCGTCEMMEQFKIFVASVCPSTTASVRRHAENLWVWSTRCQSAANLADALYRDASIALPRKAEIARQFIEWQKLPRLPKRR